MGRTRTWARPVASDALGTYPLMTVREEACSGHEEHMEQSFSLLDMPLQCRLVLLHEEEGGEEVDPTSSTAAKV